MTIGAFLELIGALPIIWVGYLAGGIVVLKILKKIYLFFQMGELVKLERQALASSDLDETRLTYDELLRAGCKTLANLAPPQYVVDERNRSLRV